jgi:hypothetical protein
MCGHRQWRLGLEKIVRSPTISQTYAGCHGEYTGIFLHVKLQIEQPPLKNLESVKTTHVIKVSKYLQHSQSKGHSGVSGAE